MNYFEHAIQYARIFRDGTLQMPNHANAQSWLEKIENELSPENLTCDGELHGAALRAKHKDLLDAQALCHTLIHGGTYKPAVTGFELATRAVRTHIRSERHQARRGTLDAAVQNGFTVGKRVVLSNGLHGRITKINKTRVKVLTDDQKQWNVPPRCMTLEQ